MPITKSAKKALRVSVRRKKENNATKAKLKNAIKGARIGAAKNSLTKEALSDLYRQVDIAAKKKYMHKNKAARLKSRIAKKAKITEATKASRKKIVAVLDKQTTKTAKPKVKKTVAKIK